MIRGEAVTQILCITLHVIRMPWPSHPLHVIFLRLECVGRGRVKGFGWILNLIFTPAVPSNTAIFFRIRLDRDNTVLLQ
jgi:hypothetical protein